LECPNRHGKETTVSKQGNSGEEFVPLETSSYLASAEGLADSYSTAAGTPKQRMVLMHSPMGIRSCLNISESRLELWLSPQATKSVDYRLRNFSNRDDHTRIFDRIALPGLSDAEYVSCDYDPFHSVLHYQGRDVHVAALVDQPGVVIWSDAELVVDLKTDKADTRFEAGARALSVRHPDRGLTLAFVAVAWEGEGAFEHQRSLDVGRSTYARIRLAGGQALAIGGEMEWEDPAGVLGRLTARPVEDVLAANERRVSELTASSSVTFRDRPEWEAQYALNRRVLLSCQDFGGAIPAALRGLYYLIWHMDGAVTACNVAFSGWAEYLERWARFQLSNPTWTEGPIAGWYFGQLVNGRISKQEEWGTFWAAWSAFAYWTQTGSEEFTGGAYMDNLLTSLDWIERMCWRGDRGAFVKFYKGEDPYEGTYDFGWDEAVGCPQSTRAPSWDGQGVRASYEYSFNLMMYNTYLMLAAMLPDDQARPMIQRAETLEAFLRRCRAEGFAQLLVLADGREVPDPQARRFPPGGMFVPDLSEQAEMLREDRTYDVGALEAGKEGFAHQYLSTLALQDPLWFGEENLVRFCEVYIPQCRRAGTYLQMAGSQPENVNCPDGDYHDNRPQLFATGLLQAAWVGRGLFRLPLGLAVRANGMLSRIDRYEYRGRSLSVAFEGDGREVVEVLIDDRPVQGTLQLPEQALGAAANVRVRLGEAPPDGPRLLASTVRLESARLEGGRGTYRLRAYGKNSLCIARQVGQVTVTRGGSVAPQGAVAADVRVTDGLAFVDFAGRGEFTVSVGG
jgi:hypothetical protein